MPIFEYVCRYCGTRFEKLVLSSSSAKPVKCPECGSDRVEKAVSLFSSSGNAAGLGNASSCGPTGG